MKKIAILVFLVGLLGAMVGVLLIWGVQHLRLDHESLHQLVLIENQRQAAFAQRQAQRPPVPEQGQTAVPER